MWCLEHWTSWRKLRENTPGHGTGQEFSGSDYKSIGNKARNGWMDKENVVRVHNGTLAIKRWNLAIGNNTDESGGHYG